MGSLICVPMILCVVVNVSAYGHVSVTCETPMHIWVYAYCHSHLPTCILVPIAPTYMHTIIRIRVQWYKSMRQSVPGRYQCVVCSQVDAVEDTYGPPSHNIVDNLRSSSYRAMWCPVLTVCIICCVRY